jgi:hypothetical protein
MLCFEAHITLAQEHRAVAQMVGETELWVFSEITGCPILGQGTYCYLTGYAPDSLALKEEMEAVAEQLRFHGAEPLRMKIEQIVYDTKTGRDDLV